MTQNKFRILVINPKTSSTNIALYQNEIPLLTGTVYHSNSHGQSYSPVAAQYKDRTEMILNYLVEKEINLSKLDAVCGRGGLLCAMEGGTYHINEKMLEDLKTGYGGDHPSNLGGIIAYEIASGLNIPSYIVDPVVVDELEDVARISGYPGIERRSVFHALNHKACGRRAASELGQHYEEVNLIVAHLGEGITVGAHRNGKVIDVNNGLNGEGPFTLERTGTIPPGDLIDLCYSGNFTYSEMKQELLYNGGVKGYLYTNDLTAAEKAVEEGDQNASFILTALAYQIAKEIGSISTVLDGKVDAIVLTGRLANSEVLVKKIINKIMWIADCFVYPGENELQSLAEGCLRVLRKVEDAKKYHHK
ncbi:butyrate kinase [Niallia sp. 01092]|uniref:butyrate kinase n=1 Tax=unclassified Niallia TaxID=2837522 RepID=UPI003FD0A11C